MTKHNQILNFLSLLRDSHPTIGTIFTNGGCMNLFTILRNQYPEATPYYNGDHIITKIGDYFYDINGIVNPKGYLKYTGYYNKKRLSRAFKQMMK